MRVALLCLLLTGCAVDMASEPVEGWPTLTVAEHRLPQADLTAKCEQYGAGALACAEFNLATLRCDIYYSADVPPSVEVIRHERMHCKGYDHAGATHMRDFLASYMRGR